MLSIVMLINRSGSTVLPFLGVYMIDHLHFSLEASGIVLSCYGIGSVAGSFIGGYITDKIGEYKVQACSLLASVPLFCMLPLFTTPVSLAIMILVLSTVNEIFRPANSVAITKYARPEKITQAFSLNRMAINLGFSIGPAMGGLLAAISYNFLFFFNALAAGFAGLAYIYFFRRRHRIVAYKQKKEAIKKAVPQGPALSPYADIQFILFCILCSVFSICFFQLLNTIPLFYKKAVGLNQQEIGLLLGFNGLVVVLFEMLLVYIAQRRWSMAQTMLIGSILCAASYAILGSSHHYAGLLAAISFLSLGEILILPFMSTITALRAGHNNKGAYMGMNGISVAIAFIISPLLGAQIAERYGFDNLWLGTSIILALSGAGFYYSTKVLSAKTSQ